MAGLNDAFISPRLFFFQDSIAVDEKTVVEFPEQFQKDKVQVMAVANGTQIQVYDVSNPSNPVLIGTVG